MIISLGNDFNAFSCQGWASLGATFPIGDDRGSGIWSDFGNGAIPRNAIIDSDGVVQYNSIGYNESAVTAILNDLLSVTSTENELESPEEHQLLSVFPNPFNAETLLKFELPSQGFTTLSIYDGNGQRVNQLLASDLEKGTYSISWNSRSDNGLELPSGLYIASLVHNGGQDTQKILLLK